MCGSAPSTPAPPPLPPEPPPPPTPADSSVRASGRRAAAAAASGGRAGTIATGPGGITRPPSTANQSLQVFLSDPNRKQKLGA